MLKKIDCFVYQQHVDLHAVSALEAIQRYMGFKQCMYLRRYKHWEISLETQLDAANVIDQYTQSSYYLLNPNKESYRLSLKESKKSNQFYVYIDVSSHLAPDVHPLVAILNRRYDGSINHISEKVTWECLIQATSYAEAQKLVESQLVYNNQQQGILVNPVYESYEFIFSKTALING